MADIGGSQVCHYLCMYVCRHCLRVYLVIFKSLGM